MKRQAILSICMMSMLALSAPGVQAKKMPEDVVPITKALESLQSKGLTIVKKIEYDNGTYTAKVINVDGREMKVNINAKTGEIVASKKSTNRLSALEVAKKVEDAGYRNIYKIDTEWFHDKYEVKGFDKDGKKVALDVDAKSGNIHKD